MQTKEAAGNTLPPVLDCRTSVMEPDLSWPKLPPGLDAAVVAKLGMADDTKPPGLDATADKPGAANYTNPPGLNATVAKPEAANDTKPPGLDATPAEPGAAATPGSKMSSKGGSKGAAKGAAKGAGKGRGKGRGKGHGKGCGKQAAKGAAKISTSPEPQASSPAAEAVIDSTPKPNSSSAHCSQSPEPQASSPSAEHLTQAETGSQTGPKHPASLAAFQRGFKTQQKVLEGQQTDALIANR
jgi:hypothetical protein